MKLYECFTIAEEVLPCQTKIVVRVVMRNNRLRYKPDGISSFPQTPTQVPIFPCRPNERFIKTAQLLKKVAAYAKIACGSKIKLLYFRHIRRQFAESDQVITPTPIAHVSWHRHRTTYRTRSRCDGIGKPIYPIQFWYAIRVREAEPITLSLPCPNVSVMCWTRILFDLEISYFWKIDKICHVLLSTNDNLAYSIKGILLDDGLQSID
jgi:hypothetical protein